MKIRYLCLFLLASATTLAGDAFQKGVEAYHISQYATAAEAFKDAALENETAAAHHNLALARYQEGKPGKSAWHLERALLLEPGNEQYHFKLGALRQQLGLTTSPPKSYERASQALSQQSWIILLSISLWITVAALWLPKLGGLRANLQIKAARVIGLLSLILASTALYLNCDLATQGIVLNDTQITLHAAPASAAPQIGLARPGERGQLVDQHGDYFEIKTEGGARGWISAEHYRLILFKNTPSL